MPFFPSAFILVGSFLRLQVFIATQRTRSFLDAALDITFAAIPDHRSTFPSCSTDRCANCGAQRKWGPRLEKGRNQPRGLFKLGHSG